MSGYTFSLEDSKMPGIMNLPNGEHTLTRILNGNAFPGEVQEFLGARRAQFSYPAPKVCNGKVEQDFKSITILVGQKCEDGTYSVGGEGEYTYKVQGQANVVTVDSNRELVSQIVELRNALGPAEIIDPDEFYGKLTEQSLAPSPEA